MFPHVNGLRTMEFGTPGSLREHLVNLVLHGQKRATAGLLLEYEAESEAIEHVGEHLAIVDNNGDHVGTLEVTRVEVVRFADVPDEFALAEAEGDLNAADFRKGHHAYWTRAGHTVDDDTLIVTVYFDLVTPRLAVYGTLAPGRPNHGQLAHLPGRWFSGVVRGYLHDAGWGSAMGFPGLVLGGDRGDGDEIAVVIFESASLLAEWPRLDAFEGPGYRRVTTTADTPTGPVEVNIYVLAVSP